MITGCYSLDLYCDNEAGDHAWGSFPKQFTAELGSTCRNDARAKGWMMDTRRSRAICPKCAKAGVTFNSLK